MMHAFSLVLQSMLSHPFASLMLTKAQKIVTYVKNSHKPKDKLDEFASSKESNTPCSQLARRASHQ